MLTQLIANGLLAGVTTSLLAFGFTVLYMGSRFFAFTYGASFTVAAYTLLTVSRVLPLPLAAVAAVCVACLTSVLCEMTIYTPIRRRGRSALVLMLASIGAYIVLQNAISLSFGDTTRTVRQWPIQEGYSLLAVRASGVQLLSIAVTVVALAGAGAVLKYSVIGRELRAIANDEELARAWGINVDRVVLVGAGLAGAIVGISGVLASCDTDLIPTMGFRALLLAVVGSIVGGVGSLRGAVCGGLVVGSIQHIAVWRIATQWQEALLFVVLIAVLLTRPHGILSRRA